VAIAVRSPYSAPLVATEQSGMSAWLPVRRVAASSPLSVSDEWQPLSFAHLGGIVHVVKQPLMNCEAFPSVISELIADYLFGRTAVIECAMKQYVFCAYNNKNITKESEEETNEVCERVQKGLIVLNSELTVDRGSVLASYLDQFEFAPVSQPLRLVQKFVKRARPKGESWEVESTGLQGVAEWELTWLAQVIGKGGPYFHALLMSADRLAIQHPESTGLSRLADLLMSRRLQAQANKEARPVFVGFVDNSPKIHALRVLEVLSLIVMIAVGLCLCTPIKGWEYGWSMKDEEWTFGWSPTADVWSWKQGSCLGLYIALTNLVTVLVGVAEFLAVLLLHVNANCIEWLALYKVRSVTLYVLPAMTLSVFFVQVIQPGALGWILLSTHACLFIVGSFLYSVATVPKSVTVCDRYKTVQNRNFPVAPFSVLSAYSPTIVALNLSVLLMLLIVMVFGAFATR
jgi:hypothetical protein